MSYNASHVGVLDLEAEKRALVRKKGRWFRRRGMHLLNLSVVRLPPSHISVHMAAGPVWARMISRRYIQGI